MVRFGLKLASELHGPTDLVEYATLAEASNFDFVGISDHFHPWLDRQGESPMVWPVIGGIATATDDLPVVTSVTCPIIRIHPAIVAQAAATAATMLDGRFTLGVGTGENLNEHVLGDRWPPHHVRLEMLEEAVTVLRDLWEGERVNHDGDHYTVENAKLFTLPDEPPAVAVAADGPKTARTAGEVGDGIVSVKPDADLVDTFESAAGSDAPRYAELTVSWAPDGDDAVEAYHERWGQSVLPGSLSWELPTPVHFADAIDGFPTDDVESSVPCGDDPEEYVDAVREYVDAGFDHVVIHQVGPDQEGFVEFFEEHVIPAFD